MSQQSTVEIERDQPDGRVAPSRRKAAKRPVRDSHGDVGDDEDGVHLDPEQVREQIMTRLSVTPTVAGLALGLQRNSAYTACKTGDIECFKVGHKIVVPTAPLRRRLGIDSTQPPAAHPKKQEIIKSPKPRRRR